ncbi:chloramphenicol-sensitive protein RarD [Lentzea xinjiangensis]|uniref:Chloramphenicol-sensitive protein RarD n=1 Tax=Lentzea xinjiangensis TaxID=402600 RepID=A0A1H9B9V3_9PSEU|nr:chloramphenicol-sensitive protein RarD [Lentzea xinjiangensis]
MPPLTTSALTSPEVHTQGRGITYGTAAYVLWGLFPAYWPLLVPAQPLEVLAHRVVWSFVLLAIAVAVLRRWRPFVELSGRGWLIVTAAAVLITANWGTYIYAVNSRHIVEAALGYFITPLVSVALGMIFLKERLRLSQVIAIGVVVIAVIVLTVDYGRMPVISLLLACSFGVYGLLKKKVPLDAVSSLAAESAVIAPIALVYLLALGSANTFTTEGTGHTLMILSTGIVTVIPLLLFGAGAQRIPLTTMGMLQYLAPILQFVWGVFVAHEPMPASRWIGFALVWLALAIFTFDALRPSTRRHAGAPRSPEGNAGPPRGRRSG